MEYALRLRWTERQEPHRLQHLYLMLQRVEATTCFVQLNPVQSLN